jgi:hypothetical protein
MEWECSEMMGIGKYNIQELRNICVYKNIDTKGKERWELIRNLMFKIIKETLSNKEIWVNIIPDKFKKFLKEGYIPLNSLDESFWKQKIKKDHPFATEDFLKKNKKLYPKNYEEYLKLDDYLEFGVPTDPKAWEKPYLNQFKTSPNKYFEALKYLISNYDYINTINQNKYLKYDIFEYLEADQIAWMVNLGLKISNLEINELLYMGHYDLLRMISKIKGDEFYKELEKSLKDSNKKYLISENLREVWKGDEEGLKKLYKIGVYLPPKEKKKYKSPISKEDRGSRFPEDPIGHRAKRYSDDLTSREKLRASRFF